MTTTLTIKLDNKHNFMLDKNGNTVSRLENFQDGKLIINLHDSTLEINAEKVHIEYGNQYVTYYDNYKFILDDGFQDILIKAGYIVYKDYNISRIDDKAEGLKVRDKVNKDLESVILNEQNSKDLDNLKYGYKFTIVTYTVNQIVNMNQSRKDNNLPYYPFDKDMDKYGTLYIAIYAKKIEDSNEDDMKFKYADSIVSSIVANLGPDYHYESQQIKKRLVKAEKI